jgi:hypothetical protein
MTDREKLDKIRALRSRDKRSLREAIDLISECYQLSNDMNAWNLTEAEYEEARVRENNKHYSADDRSDYFQLCRFYRGQIFHLDQAARALKHLRGNA